MKLASVFGGHEEKTGLGYSRLVGGCFNNPMELIFETRLVWQQDEWSPPFCQTVKVLKEASLNRIHHRYRAGVLNTTSLPQADVLGAASGRGKSMQSQHSENKGEGETLMPQVQLAGQPVVMALPQSSPTYSHILDQLHENYKK